MNHVFWNDIENVKKMFLLIFEQQKMFEITKIHIERVISRWQIIETHIRDFIRRFEYAFESILTKLFKSRFENDKHLKSLWQIRTKIQILNIHWAVYHLNSINHMIVLNENTLSRIMNFIKKYVVDLNFDTTMKHFFDFKMRHDRKKLLISNEIWNKQNKFLHFWKIIQIFVFLSKLRIDYF